MGAVSIAERPEEVEGRQVPGHHEGDLILGSTESSSAVATIVERVSGYLVLGHLPARPRIRSRLRRRRRGDEPLPDRLAKTLTWDRGIEMANHAELTQRTGIDVYFADPLLTLAARQQREHQRPGPRVPPQEHRPELHSAADLAAIATELNNRPRKRLGYLTPAEALANIQAKDQGVATTAYPIRAVLHHLRGCAGDHRTELVAAEAEREVVGAKNGSDDRSDPAQHRVTAGVAEPVVDALELVDVDDHHGDRCLRRSSLLPSSASR